MPRIALISDIHGNIDALEAVLEDIRSQRIDEIYCLGDIVGYGAAPAECLRLIRQHCSETILGNHDTYLIRGLENCTLSKRLADPLRLAERNLSRAEMQWLESRPLITQAYGFTLVHGSLHKPEAFHYILDESSALLHFAEQESPLCFYGHTHRPAKTSKRGETIQDHLLFEGETLLDSSKLTAINVGSVGQPRDKDPRASYGIYDTEQNSFSLRRVAYEIEKAIQRIVEAGISEDNGARLKQGD